MSQPVVTITQNGRSGDVTYTERGRRITGWWEFGGGDAIAIVNMGGAEEWERSHGWAAPHRSAILRFVADEIVRQKAVGCRAEIDEHGGWIEIKR
ncbi:MAG: hypothetical protein JNM31_12605 [Flavobacteriales bacterium]|nr:hypothetical protein [Flavobacteriales bacterium]